MDKEHEVYFQLVYVLQNLFCFNYKFYFNHWL